MKKNLTPEQARDLEIKVKKLYSDFGDIAVKYVPYSNVKSRFGKLIDKMNANMRELGVIAWNVAGDVEAGRNPPDMK